MVRIYPLQLKLEGEWAQNTNTTLGMNISDVYNNGTLLTLSDLVNYSQDNLDNESDMINITFADVSYFDVLNITNLSTWLYCLKPYNASTRTANEWTPTGGERRIITYYSDEDSSASGIMTTFSPTTDNSYSMMYNDSDGHWLQTIHLDWISSLSRLNFWDETNYTYVHQSIRKEHVSCKLNSSIILNFTSGPNLDLIIPIDINLTYNNATVRTNLTLVRK